MTLVIAVVGTATDVGKTWVGATLVRMLRSRGLRVVARKPAQSFEPGTGPTDADVLGAATEESPFHVCPEHRWYPVPVAPPMATVILGRAPLTLAEATTELIWSDGVDVALVESVGGVRSPICDDADSAEFIAAVRPDVVVLVADAGLGTINAVRLSAAALTASGALGSVAPLCVVLNRYDDSDDLHRRNRDWLVGRDAMNVSTTVAELAEVLEQLLETAPTLTD